MSKSGITIGDRQIGAGSPCFVIAEAGINHNGDIDIAKQLICAAADAGCDAVKFQTYRTEAIAAPGAPMAEYQMANTGLCGSQADLLKRCELDGEAHVELMNECLNAGVFFLSTPFDDPSLDLLIGLGVKALKISSGDVTNTPFLKRVAVAGLPVILSTGMATLPEVAEAVDALRGAGCEDFALLHCVSCYPAKPSECHLPAMGLLHTAFHVPVGFSDHTTGFDITLAAVARGAAIIEKHITTDRALPGPDHAASIEPWELKEMMAAIRRVEAALSGTGKNPSAEELGTANVARKSLHLRVSLPAGSVLCEEHLTAMRPGTGISPSRIHEVLGRQLIEDAVAGTMLSLGMLK